MPDEKNPREDELENRQGNLYPVGRALRRTFDAENHDSLGTDLTGLMLELARIDAENAPGRGAIPVVPPAAAAPADPPVPAAAPGRSWWRSAVDRLLD